METPYFLIRKVQDCVQDVFTDLWIYRDKLSDKVVVKAYLLACVRKRITRSQGIVFLG
jgi:DNA-directed RNA polymerase specialized sigma24 family protein